MEIKKTTDYSIFKIIKGNRTINPNHVKNLEKAIAERDLLSVNPIIVNSRMEIIDGQHRLMAAKRMKRPIYYVVLPEGELQEVQLLNTNNRHWSTADYLQSYIVQGNKDYLELRDFVDAYKVSISIAIQLFTNVSDNWRPNLTLKEFKEGDFRATNKAHAEEMIKRLQELKAYCVDDVTADRDFIRALNVAYGRIEHEELIRQLKTHGLIIERQALMKDYLRDLERIINFKVRGEGKRLF